MTIGSYNSIVVPLCHCFCKTLILSVSIYNIQTTLINQITMASFIKIKTTANINTGLGFFINPEKIVSVQSDGGDPSITLISLIPSGNQPNVAPQVYQLEIDCDPGSTPSGEFPITRAMNAAIETAILNPGVVVDFNAILKTIAVSDLVVTAVLVVNY